MGECSESVCAIYNGTLRSYLLKCDNLFVHKRFSLMQG